LRDFIYSLPGCNEDDKRAWDELCPEGAIRFYEGPDPDGFAEQIRELYGFDVTRTYEDEYERTNWAERRSFFIPAGLVGEIYGVGRWPLGS